MFRNFRNNLFDANSGKPGKNMNTPENTPQKGSDRRKDQTAAHNLPGPFGSPRPLLHLRSCHRENLPEIASYRIEKARGWGRPPELKRVTKGPKRGRDEEHPINRDPPIAPDPRVGAVGISGWPARRPAPSYRPLLHFSSTPRESPEGGELLPKIS